MSILTLDEQCDLFGKLNVRANAYAAMVHWRAVQAYQAAFGHTAKPGDQLDCCIIHNSIISAEQGKPWAEVNYSHMRRARWLLEYRQYEAHRLLRAMYSRKWHEWRDAGCPVKAAH
jgi:hypothetical protein